MKLFCRGTIVLGALICLTRVTLAETVVYPSDDAAVFTRSDLPSIANTNFGGNHLFAGSWEPGVVSLSRSLLKFALPAIPGTQSLQSAKLRLAVGKEYPGNGTHDVFLVDDAWSEGTVTWMTAPQPLPFQQPIGTFIDNANIPPVSSWTWITLDITSAVLSQYNTDGVISLLWKDRDEDATNLNRLRAYSKEAAVIEDQRPRLTLTFVPEPSTLALLCGAIAFAPVVHCVRRKR
jgi:hypothetical protein